MAAAAADGRPAQPKAVLRGHKAQVHAAAFIRRNDRLVTGDADGFVIAWDLTIMRPRAVWQAHENAILGIAGWGDDRLITHGRDHKLIVWKLTAAKDERALSTKLPLDPSPETRPQPWMLHMIEVNTMNFCSFSHCPTSPGSGSSPSEILIAVPNTLASEAIDIFHLPSQTRQHTVKLGDKNGMVMALALFHHPATQTLTLAAGYENGAATVAQFDNTTNLWTVRYHSQSHSQPILSLDVSPARDYFLTSSADAILAKHPLTFPPLPLIKPPPTTTTATAAILTTPLKTLNTKHAGQQSLRIRSDARVFATAGWDARIRIYSARTLAEVAVLKWHTVGCYAAAFAEVDVPREGEERQGGEGGSRDGVDGEGGGDGEVSKSQEVVLAPKLVEVTVREKRERLARTAHWLAAGSKDGKVSLWDVF
ncbi:ASTRA-associated protein 1 [Staphylotrichum tortipilum]|uniref:ASTRA-associated protein 1 n=1 Tax=Staphylotrichum tortipilum TaxID=2831512 RepID=A0AAN6MT47_9PEZI|nr:ASTRA-associated protein 1 [Staphylotrichum longicolle]